MSPDLDDDAALSARVSHMLRLRRGLQSALSHPFSVISPPLFFPNGAVRGCDSAPAPCTPHPHPTPLCLSPLITVCSYEKQKPQGRKDVQFWQKMRKTQIRRVFLPPPRAHTLAHRGGDCGSNGCRHNSVPNQRRTDTTVTVTPTQSELCFAILCAKSKPGNRFATNSMIKFHCGPLNTKTFLKLN